MQSVFDQTFKDFEYVVIDGASTDGSVQVVQRFVSQFGGRLIWVSESDNGIYNAMNKGIKMATGDYIQILNSGDILASDKVVGLIMAELERKGQPAILYGNMIKCFPNGLNIVDKSYAGQEVTMLGMYTGTLNHDPTFIRRVLFERYGYYDESLKIVSDWKWFLEAIVLGGEKPMYVDLDVTLFDMTGISEANENKEMIWSERRKVITELFPRAIINDYDAYSRDIFIMRRIHRHPWAYAVVRFLERCLFRVEKQQRKQRHLWG